MVLARLAVSTAWQGQRIGSGLLKDAVLRTLQAAAIAGERLGAFVVDEVALARGAGENAEQLGAQGHRTPRSNALR